MISLLRKTENHEPLFAEKPGRHFLSKGKQYFSFIEILSKSSESFCLVIVLKNTFHIATLRTGLIVYIESPITTRNHSIIDFLIFIH